MATNSYLLGAVCVVAGFAIGMSILIVIRRGAAQQAALLKSQVKRLEAALASAPGEALHNTTLNLREQIRIFDQAITECRGQLEQCEVDVVRARNRNEESDPSGISDAVAVAAEDLARATKKRDFLKSHIGASVARKLAWIEFASAVERPDFGKIAADAARKDMATALQRIETTRSNPDDVATRAIEDTRSRWRMYTQRSQIAENERNERHLRSGDR